MDAGYKVISYNTIYRGIYRDNLMIKKNHGTRGIARQLRHRGKTRKHSGFLDRRGQLPIPHTIHERPVEADERLRIGDWELDTIVGKTGGQVLVTLTDRKTRILKAHKAASKRTQDVMNVIEHIFCELQVMKLKRLPLIVEKNSVQTNGFQMNLTLHFIFLIRMRHGNEEQMKIQMA